MRAIGGRTRAAAVEAIVSEMRRRPKRKRKPPAQARPALAAGEPPSLRWRVELEPHHVDIIGLALIAVGIFLGGVAYLHWAGGDARRRRGRRAMRFVFGALGYAIPAALVAGGALILARELRPPGPAAAHRADLCLTAALTLALAAGTLGLGPGRAPAAQFWHADRVRVPRRRSSARPSCGSSSHLLSSVGADILAVFLFDRRR